jgi:ABC-type phosphate/phosphonate transport system permease subunit
VVDEIKMDKFTKYALLTMAIIVVIMVVSTYIGAEVFNARMEGTDAQVNNSTHATSWFGFKFTADAWGQLGEYIGFSAAGGVGGLIVGYSFPAIFAKSINEPSKEDKN